MGRKVVTYTLSVYDQTGSSVVFAVSSVVGDSLPYLSSEPSGDGQEFDPLSGDTRAGRYVGRIVDAITSGTTRAVTSRLEDSYYRQQLMRRKAILKQTIDGTDEVLVAGVLTRLTLAGEAEYEFEVTDRTKIRSDVQIFAPRAGTVTLTAGASIGATSLSCSALTIAVPKNQVLNFGSGKIAVVSSQANAGATSISVTALTLAVSNGDVANYREPVADFITRWPHRGCAFGGPIIGGGILNVPDKGGWLMRVQRDDAGLNGPLLAFQQGYGPPNFTRLVTNINDAAIMKATNDRVGQWNPGRVTNALAVGTTGSVTTFDQTDLSGFAKDLVIEVLSETGGTSYGYYMPGIYGITVGQALPSLVDGGHSKSGGGASAPAGVWLANMTTAQYNASGLPALGSRVRARAFTVSPSDVSPIYISLHPVDLVTTILTELGYSYDSSSATTVKGTLGADLLYVDRITEPKTAADYLSSILGAFGIGLRMKDNGDLELFASRILNNALPSTTITAADVVTPDESDAGPVFEIMESTAIAKVVVETSTLSLVKSDASDFPPDGVSVRAVRIERKNGDPGAVGDRTHTWTISGMVTRLGKNEHDADYWDVPIREVFDRFGRGLIQASTQFIRGGNGDSLRLGDELILALPQLPNHNKRYGDDNSVGGRAMQIIRRTPRKEGAVVLLADTGPNAQPLSTVPTITVAASSAYPNTVAQVTITNAATLNALGAGVRIRMSATTGSTPASTDYADALSYAPGTIPTTAINLPSVAQGRKVFVIARAETFSDRPSNYCAASSVTLTAYTAPSSVSVSAVSGDGTKATMTWTVGDSTLRTDIFVRVTSGTTASDDVLVESVEPGTSQYTLTQLKPGTGHTISVRHRNPITGDVTGKATGTVTTSTTIASLPAPDGTRGWVGKQDESFGIPTYASSYGIAGRSNLQPMDLEAYEAVETSVGSGTYGSYTRLGRVPARQGTWTPIGGNCPNDGLRRQIIMRAVPSGLHPGIASLSVTDAAALSVAQAAAMDDIAGTFSSVVTVTPYSNTAIQKTTKTIRLSAAGVTWFTTTPANLQLINATLAPATKGTATANMLVSLPVGSTITGWRFRSVSRSPGASIQVVFNRGDDDVQTGIDVDSNLDGTNVFRTTTTRTLSQAVDGSTFYVTINLATAAATSAADAALAWIEFDYTSPYLDVSL